MITRVFAERRGFEPRRQLPVDRLAICSITTLAPLLTQKVFHALKTRLQMYFLEYNITTFLKLFLALFFIDPELLWICNPKVVDIS